MAKIRFTNGAEPATPPSGKIDLFAKTDKRLYYKNQDGTVIGPVGSGGIVGPTRTVYLDIDGDDGTGQRGDASKPFKTLKAALGACLTNDVLRMSAGTFAITSPADVPVWPAGCALLSVVGEGRGDTSIVSNVMGAHIFNPPPNAAFAQFRDFSAATIGAGNTGRPFHFDGTTGGGIFMASGAYFLNVRAEADSVAMHLKGVNLAFSDSLLTAFGTGKLIVETSNLVQCTNSFLGDVDVSWDNTYADVPTIGRIDSGFVNTNIETLTMSAHPKVSIGYGTHVATLTATGLSGTLVGPGAPMGPSLTFQGSTGGVSLSGAAALPDFLTQHWVFEDARINGAFSIAVVGAAPVNRQPVNLRNWNPSGPVTIGKGIDAQAFSAKADTGFYSTPDALPSGGTITPAMWSVTLNIPGPGPLVVPYGFNVGGVPKAIVATPGNVANAPVSASAVPIPQENFTLDYAGAGGAISVVATWI